jgi:hypothetical protein
LTGNFLISFANVQSWERGEDREADYEISLLVSRVGGGWQEQQAQPSTVPILQHLPFCFNHDLKWSSSKCQALARAVPLLQNPGKDWSEMITIKPWKRGSEECLILS